MDGGWDISNKSGHPGTEAVQMEWNTTVFDGQTFVVSSTHDI